MPAARRREAILAAARDLFAREGYERSSMRRIAARVGVSSTALYVHFRDKQALMHALCNALFAGLVEGFRRVAAGPARTRLARMMRAYVEWGLANPREYRLLFMTPVAGIGAGHRPGPGVTRTAASDRGMEAFALFQAEVAAAMRARVLRRMDPALAAELLWAAGHGLVALLITHGEFPFSPRARLIDGLLAALLRGFGGPGQRPRNGLGRPGRVRGGSVRAR